MVDAKAPDSRPDAYDLYRFVQAQADDYERALSEIRSGRKQSHWMWYIFPQIAGLGSSSMSVRFGIKSVSEAEAYLHHPLLGSRLDECVKAVLNHDGRTALEIFGSPDDMKLRSCATLFSHISPSGSPFEQLLGKYYRGAADAATLELIRKESG